MEKTIEIRNLPAATIFKLSQILDSGDAWEKVMAMVPSDPIDFDSAPKYTLQHIKLIKSASEKQNKSSTEIFLDEWGTSGKIRPDLNTLLKILVKAQLYRAAEFVAVDLLKEVSPATVMAGKVSGNKTNLAALKITKASKPPDRPLHGPAAIVTLPNLKSEIVLESKTHLDSICHFSYSELKATTNNFDDTPLMQCLHNDGFFHFVGHKIGTGAFGTVYFGHLDSGTKIAVKKLSTTTTNWKNQFENEIQMLSAYRHVNLVPLLGFSCDTSNYCLVYEFMSNGSLLDKLQMKKTLRISCGRPDTVKCSTVESSQPLSWTRRTNIAIDVCEGIHFLHTSKSFPLIHRDIKTANILLDNNLTAKLGDFGLVKIKPNTTESKLLTSTVFGTSAYMAPEAFRGDVSVKMDVFSFGVVLLELLTGLPPYDENRDGCDLVTYIDEVVEDSIDFLLDKKAGVWDTSVARQMFKLSQTCLEEKKSRPLIGEIKQKLEEMWGNIPTAEVFSC